MDVKTLEIIALLIPLLTAVIGLATAILGIKASRARPEPSPIAQRPRVLRFLNPTVRTRSWNMRKIKWLTLVFYVGYVGIVATAFHDTRLSLFTGAVALITIGIMFSLRDQPPSRTIKTVDLVVADNPDKLLEHCLSALGRIKAKIGKYDPAGGVIEARTPFSWRSFGEIITITAKRIGDNETALRIESDAIQPSILFDFGANARNIRAIEAEFLGIKN